MNKKQVEIYLPLAIKALTDESRGACEIRTKVKEKDSGEEKWTNQIQKTYRGQISAFGAAIVMGSFKSAVAFFSEDGGGKVKRSELLRAMYWIVHQEWKKVDLIFREIAALAEPKLSQEKDAFINASLALKLAMNAFELTD